MLSTEDAKHVLELSKIGNDFSTRNVPIEEKIDIIAQTKWAQDWARGMCRFVSEVPTESCIDRLSHRVARKIL